MRLPAKTDLRDVADGSSAWRRPSWASTILAILASRQDNCTRSINYASFQRSGQAVGAARTFQLRTAHIIPATFRVSSGRGFEGTSSGLRSE